MPQGSVLGPLLFLVYINDITENIDSHIKLFADDTSLFITIDSNEQEQTSQLNRDLAQISKWAETWLVSFNPTKTTSLYVTLKKPKDHPPLFFDGHQLETVDTHKHLGITFNSNLSWKQHVDNISITANKKVVLLCKLKHLLDRKTLLTMYLSFIRPTLEYANVVWVNCTDNDCDQLESIQRRAARIITGGIIRTPTKLLYDEIGLEPLKSRRDRNSILLLHKIINGNIPTYLQELKPEENNHRLGRNLRSSNLLRTPKCRITKYQSSFLPRAINLWNKLSNNLISTRNYDTFKTMLEVSCPKVNLLFYLGEQNENIVMARMRMNCSNLRGQLYNLNIIVQAQCDCGYPVEDSMHYFFVCPLYLGPRAALHNSVSILAPFTLQTLLFGRNDLEISVNQDIILSTIKYITQTKRFESN